MDRRAGIEKIRATLRSGGVSIGSWMQLPNASVAEIMGGAGYDWVAADLEHGSFGLHVLPDIFRALELGDTLPLVRLARAHPKDCKHALDAGAGGVIAPMIENAAQLTAVRDACRWPPAGTRGVGFSRANLFGKHFETYRHEAQQPLLIAMIESKAAVENLANIVDVEGLDALLIGPYDLSASLGRTAQFETDEFKAAMRKILSIADQASVPCGIHVVDADPGQLERRIEEGYRFVVYSIDAVLLNRAAQRPVPGSHEAA